MSDQVAAAAETGLERDLDAQLTYVRPDPSLDGLVSGYHIYAVDPGPGRRYSDVFYPGWANIRFQTSGDPWRITIGTDIIDPVPRASIFGPSSRALYSECGRGILVGAGLTPLGWHRLTTLPALKFADRVAPLEELLGAETAALARAVSTAEPATVAAAFDDFFLKKMAHRRGSEDRVLAIHKLLDDDYPLDVAHAAATLGLHERTFNRISQSTFGFGPKLLLRRARFLRSLMALRLPSELPWSRRIGSAYCDQSHFVRDSHEFLGMTPGDFLRLNKPMSDRSLALRSATLGAPVQALGRPPTRA